MAKLTRLTIFSVAVPGFICLWLIFPKLGCLPCQADSANLHQAIQLYQAQKFNESLKCLDLLLKQDERNALAHYYRASALINLNRLPEAQVDYRKAELYSHESQISQYCAIALKRIDQIEQGNAKPSVSANKTSKLTNLINGQADQFSLNILKDGTNAAQRIDDQGSGQARTRRNELENQASRMQNSQYTVMRGNVPVTVKPYSDEEIRAVKDQAQEEEQDILNQMKDQRDKTLDAAKERALAAQSAAAALERQLNLPTSNGGMQLLKDGTNLYVRNYLFVPHQPVLGVAGQAGKGDFDLPLLATPKLLEDVLHPVQAPSNNGRASTADVYGRLLK